MPSVEGVPTIDPRHTIGVTRAVSVVRHLLVAGPRGTSPFTEGDTAIDEPAWLAGQA
jgi:hypothetical protein